MYTVKEEIGKKFKRSISLALMGSFCTASMFSVGAFSRKVDIVINNDVISAITLSDDTEKILRQVGIEVSDDDKIERYDGDDGTLKLNITKAFEVTVLEGDTVKKLKMTSGNVRDAILKAGINIDDHYLGNFDLDKNLEPNMQITIAKGFKIKVVADGAIKENLVPMGTVKNALDFLNVSLSPEDMINVDISSDIYEDMEIVINRVIYQEKITEEEIPFKRVVKKTELLDKGKQEITLPGTKGRCEVKIREMLVDGELAKSEIVERKVIAEPKDEVVLEGTKTHQHHPTTSAPAPVDDIKSVTKEPSNNSRVIEGSATAYTAPSGARTSTGNIPVQGVTVAVNPGVIPYGSKVTIKSLSGYTIWQGIAQDTGGALMCGSAVVDIYMNNKLDCVNFGRKKVKVYF